MNYPEDIGKFLQTYPWDYFLTVTPKRERRDSIAFMRDVWQELQPLPGNMVKGQPSRAFLATEPFFLGHNLHVHGIVYGGPDVNLPWYIEDGLNRHLGRSRVELCVSPGEVAEYCSKYVSKFLGNDNYDFFGEWI